MKTFLTLDPWDLMAPAAGSLLDRYAGELGATGVSVWLGLPATMRLRPPNYEPRVMQTRGGLFFHPGEAGFDATRLKPIVSGQVSRRDGLAQAAAACHDRGLLLRANVSLSKLGRVAHRHPEMACRNVFGATTREGVCLVNPDVQAFYAALLGELSERDTFDAITLADGFFSWTESFEAPGLTSVPIGPVGGMLLSICFCESCMQRAGDAGVDVLAARRSVAVRLDASFARSIPADLTLSAWLADDVPLQAYVTWRGQALSALWSRLAGACRCDLVMDVSSGLGLGKECAANLCAGTACAAFGPVDYSSLAGVMSDSWSGEGTPPLGQDAASHGKIVGCSCVPSDESGGGCSATTAKRRELRISPSCWVGGHGPELVTKMSRAAEAGMAAAQIDGVSSLPDSALDSVRQAIRFVRRSV